MTIIEKLNDLLIQATTERSHYYVASVVKESIAELTALTATNDRLSSKVRYYEGELCTTGLIALHDGNTAKAIDTQKVISVLAERDRLREALEKIIAKVSVEPIHPLMILIRDIAQAALEEGK